MAQNNRRGRSGRRRSGGNNANNPNRSMDSQGPEVKIRGNAQQIYDKYTALARDAFSSGDRIRGESLQQHAEHYYRMLQAMKPPESKDQPKPDDGAQAPQGDKDAQSAEKDKDRSDDGGEGAERKPRRERRPRREERADVEEQPQAEKADAPSDRPAVQTDGHEGDEASGEDKPRRRRSRRRKADDEASEDRSTDEASSEEAPAA